MPKSGSMTDLAKKEEALSRPMVWVSETSFRKKVEAKRLTFPSCGRGVH